MAFDAEKANEFLHRLWYEERGLKMDKFSRITPEGKEIIIYEKEKKA